MIQVLLELATKKKEIWEILLVYDDATASYWGLSTIIVYNYVSCCVPDFYAERVWQAIRCPDHESVGTGAVNGSIAHELGIAATLVHNQPHIAGASEIAISCMELEFGTTGRHVGTFSIFRYEAECGYSLQIWISMVGAGK